MLDYASEEADDMDEDIDVPPYMAPSLATSNTGKWTATSTYDVYMVDTTMKDGDTTKKDGDDPIEEPPRRRRRRARGRGKGKENHTDMNGTGDNDTPDNMGELGDNTHE